MPWPRLALPIFAISIALAAKPPVIAESISERATKLHFSSIVLDTHDDTTQYMLDATFDLAERHEGGNVDIPRMKQGGMNAIFFSIYMPGTVKGPEAVKRALQQIDAVREAVRSHPGDLTLAVTAQEVRKIHDNGKIAVLMGVEGGHMIASDLGILRTYAALGARYMTLTHSLNDEWADSSSDKSEHNGLTEFGKQVVREMNRLGVMVDISHVSDKTFYDALAVSKAPLIASHSSCRAIFGTSRNMSDDMIRALAARGGVIQIAFGVGFFSRKFDDAFAADGNISRDSGVEMKKRCGDNGSEYCYTTEGQRILREYQAAGRLPMVDFSGVIDNIEHVIKLVGVDHVGLGSDFDGSFTPAGLEDCSKLPNITEALVRRGYSDEDIRKILGENLLRVMEQTERVSGELQRAGEVQHANN